MCKIFLKSYVDVGIPQAMIYMVGIYAIQLAGNIQYNMVVWFYEKEQNLMRVNDF